MKTKLLAILLVGLVATGTSCSDRGDDEAASYPVADTPQQVIANMQKAILAVDKDAFMACFTGSGNARRIMSQVFDFSVAMQSFRNELVEVYGEEAAEEFDGPGGMFDDFEEASFDDLTSEIDGDTAVCTGGRGGKPTKLVRIDGVWYVVIPEEDMPTRVLAEYGLAIMEVSIDIVKDVAQRIGNDGVTIDRLERELELELEGAPVALARRIMGPEELEQASPSAVMRAVMDYCAARAEETAETLDDLRALYQANGDDPAVRERLATDLLGAVIAAREEGDLPAAEAFLQEIRDIIAEHPDDSFVANLLEELDD